jgi:hypothetical protein
MNLALCAIALIWLAPIFLSAAALVLGLIYPPLRRSINIVLFGEPFPAPLRNDPPDTTCTP